MSNNSAVFKAFCAEMDRYLANDENVQIGEPGEMFDLRYKIISSIGEGSFGKVVKAYDYDNGSFVAIKIIKNTKREFKQARHEIQMLEKIKEADPGNSHYYIVKLKSHFIWRSHMCLVFELLSNSLRQIMRNTNYQGVSLNLAIKIGRQLCEALQFLSRPALNIIHSDLKPENVVLHNLTKPAIAVIDFGNAFQYGEEVDLNRYIQTRCYRSPEALLGIQYDSAMDMWSVGCIFVEMHIGVPLFRGENEIDQMNKIIEVLGMPPKRILERAGKVEKFFNKVPGGFILKTPNDGTTYEPPGTRSLHKILGSQTGGPGGRRIDERGHSVLDYIKFVKLIRRMLDYDPDTRITPDEALRDACFHTLYTRACK